MKCSANSKKNVDIFKFLLKRLIVGTSGGSNENPQSMFLNKNNDIRGIIKNYVDFSDNL